MKVVGIAVLLAGILFTVLSFFSSPENTTTYTSGWGPWIGILVIAAGAVTIFKSRKE